MARSTTRPSKGVPPPDGSRKKVSIKRLMILLAAGVVVLLAALFFLRAVFGGSWDVAIATASPGGTYYPVGQQLARILNRLPAGHVRSARADSTRGSGENIRRLLDDEQPAGSAPIAFVMGPALGDAARRNERVNEELRILSRLYEDVLMILVRKGADISSVADLENKRIFTGLDSSGTRLAADQVLREAEVFLSDENRDDSESFNKAASRLINDSLDAAFFMAAMPARAVAMPLDTGKVDLLSLDSTIVDRLCAEVEGGGFEKYTIPANTFPNQPSTIHTVSAPVFLIARSDMHGRLALTILGALFDNLEDLLLAHPKAQDIRVTEAFNTAGLSLGLHPGARKFERKQERVLLIATGALNGKYHHLGRRIQSLLEERRIRSRWIPWFIEKRRKRTRLVQTDGSFANAELIKRRSTIAIMQYDAALATRFGEPSFVYSVERAELDSAQVVPEIRRIAALHEEIVHVIARRDKLESLGEWNRRNARAFDRQGITTLNELAEAGRGLASEGELLRVGLGPEKSATRAVAEAILQHHHIDSSSVTRTFLPVADMVSRLHGGEIDLGVFVSYVPGEALKTVLNDPTFRLLSLGSQETAPLTHTVFTASTIEPGTYGCQRAGEPPVQTISTRAVLVTRDDLPFDIKAITRAVFEGEAYLGIEGGADTMAARLPSVPLHGSAESAYRELGLRPAKPRIDRIALTWRLLACLVILAGAYKGLIALLRERTSKAISRRILAIPLTADVPDSVERLAEIRDEIRERVRKRWWRMGELDKQRWQDLRMLINGRIVEAKENLTRAIATDVGAIAVDRELDEATRALRCESLERRIWEYYREGELDSAHLQLLRGLLGECTSART